MADDLSQASKILDGIVKLEQQRATLSKVTATTQAEMTANYVKMFANASSMRVEMDKMKALTAEMSDASALELEKKQASIDATQTIAKLNEDINGSLIDIANKYKVNIDLNARVVMDEKQKLDLIRQQGTEQQKNMAKAIATARDAQAANTGTQQFLGVADNMNGTSRDQNIATTRGYGDKALGSAMEKLVSGNYAAAAAQFALGAVMKIAQAQLEQLPFKLSAYNAQLKSGGSLQEAVNAGTSGYHLNLKKSAYAFGRNSEEIQAATDLIAGRLNVNIKQMSEQASGGGGMLKDISNISGTFGMSMEDSAKMYTNMNASYRRNIKAKDADTKTMEDFTALSARGAEVYKSGYSTMSEFKDQTMQAFTATSDYNQSLTEVAAVAESLTRIKGVNAVNPESLGNHAAAIISNAQNLSPAAIMAMTGGGLSSAWDWNSRSATDQQDVLNKFGGGVMSGEGKSPGMKMVSAMIRSSLTGLDDRNSRIAVDASATPALTQETLKATKTAMEASTLLYKQLQGTAQDVARLKDISTAIMSAKLGGGQPFIVKLVEH